MSIFPCNFYNTFLTDSTILPLSNHPVETWAELYDDEYFSVYSLLNSNKTRVKTVDFNYEQNILRASAPRSLFEHYFCRGLPTLNFNKTDYGDINVCSAQSALENNIEGFTNVLYPDDIKGVKFYNRLKVTGGISECWEEDTYYLCSYAAANDSLEKFETLLSFCNGSVFVERDEVFSKFILPIFPKRSRYRNLLYTLSKERLEMGTSLLSYMKGENPLFDRILARVSEQGLYNYWYNRFFHAQGALLFANKVFDNPGFNAQGLHSNILGAFLIYRFFIVLCLFFFVIEVTYFNRKNLRIAFQLVCIIADYSSSFLHFNINRDKQEISVKIKPGLSDGRKYHYKMLKSLFKILK